MAKNGDELSLPCNELTHLCDEVLRVPFELNVVPDINSKEVNELKLEFLAWFVGITQDETNKSIKPEIGWIVREEASGETIFHDDTPFEKIDLGEFQY